jgi:hypothetical protein
MSSTSEALDNNTSELSKDIIVPGIRKFLKTYPLEAPATQDLNNHPANVSVREKYGTCILPLWRQTTELHKGSEHWQAFTELFRVIQPLITIACNVVANQGEGNDLYGQTKQRFQEQVNNPPLEPCH